MSQQLTVSLSPHEKGKLSVSNVMLTVILALTPAGIAGVYFFGIRTLLLMAVSIGAAVLTEWFIQKILLKQTPQINDLSAIVAGLLLSYNVPSSLPLWQMAAGSIFAMGVAKMVFGGLGNNPFNPALAGRAFMLASFPAEMTTWPLPIKTRWLLTTDAFSMASPDAMTGATPLGLIKENLASGGSMADISSEIPSILDLLFGFRGGCIAETSIIALLAGGIFLLAKGTINWRIPVMYLTTLGVFTGAFWIADPVHYAGPHLHLLTGGVVLGAFFMATDMVTSPMSKTGQIIYAVGGGLLAGAIRLFGSYPEGCSYSILIMNALVPLIDRKFKPRRFGKEVNYG